MDAKLKKEVDEIIEIGENIQNSNLNEEMKNEIFSYFLKLKKSQYFNTGTPKPPDEEGNDIDYELNAGTNSFMRRYQVSIQELQQVYHLEHENIDYLLPGLDASNNKEGLRQCICLVGIKNLIEHGSYKVNLSELRELAGNLGVYDYSNFSAYMKGNKDILKKYEPGKDTELNAMGIKEAAQLIKKLGGR
jgi:hypothetical protein